MCSGVWDVGVRASVDTHGCCGTDQAAPGPALLSSRPAPRLPPLDPAVLLHSWPGSGCPGSHTLWTLPAQRIAGSLMLSPPGWGMERLLLSLLLLIH